MASKLLEREMLDLGTTIIPQVYPHSSYQLGDLTCSSKCRCNCSKLVRPNRKTAAAVYPAWVCLNSTIELCQQGQVAIILHHLSCSSFSSSKHKSSRDRVLEVLLLECPLMEQHLLLSFKFRKSISRLSNLRKT